jgi:hypothetical protein
MVTAQNLLAWLGQDTADPVAVAQAGQALDAITGMVSAYCRGQERVPATTDYHPGVEGVILAAAARLYANPEQINHDVGAVSMRGGFAGFNLAEQAVLNRYRVRAG